MLAQLRRDSHRRKGRGPLGGLARRFLLASLAPVALGAFVARGGGAPPWAPGPTIAIRVPDPAHPSNDRRDSDCDGLSDAEEFAVAPAGTGTDPADWDSDDDGLADGVELGRVASLDLACSTTWVDLDPTTRSDPGSYDSDDDGLADGLEDRNRNGRVDDGESDPRAVDTDGDGLPDGVEDRNRNGRLDPGETSPIRADTDRDGHRDGAERVRGT
ncbi:MAG: hypothetical protein MUF34_31910, partial [Polyangiaceae bacterium]|nr:hypothetical protein [Polyangiaceae bacterium]